VEFFCYKAYKTNLAFVNSFLSTHTLECFLDVVEKSIHDGEISIVCCVRNHVNSHFVFTNFLQNIGSSLLYRGDQYGYASH